jgi:hypothetical protein
MNIIWEHAWDMLNEHFQHVAESLLIDHPTMSWSCGHSDNEAFPFRAYASFSGRGPQESDAVISVDFLRQGDEIQYVADITREDGQVLVEGPTGIIKITGNIGTLREQILTAIRDSAQFVDNAEDLLRREIWRATS